MKDNALYKISKLNSFFFHIMNSVTRQCNFRGDLLRFVPNIKNGVEIEFHCDSDSLGQMWLIGIGH